MTEQNSKRKKRIIAIGIVLLLLIAITVLLILFIPRDLITVIPDLKTIEKNQVNSFEIIIREPEYPDNSSYFYIADEMRIEEYIDILNKIKVKRVLSTTSEQYRQYEIKINMIDGSNKILRLNGTLVVDTQYKVINEWLIHLFNGSDTDIDFDGKGNHSYIDEQFYSDVEGITLLSDKASFEHYLDTLIDKGEDSLRTRAFFKEVYTDEYFELKSIIMLNYKIPQGKTSVGIDSLIVDGDTLNIVINLETAPQNSYSAKIYKLFMIEVNASDITDFSDYRIAVRDFSEL